MERNQHVDLIKAGIDAYFLARTAKNEAAALFEAIENSLIDLIGCKQEGTFTLTVGDFRITTTGTTEFMARDDDAFEILRSSVPPLFFQRLFNEYGYANKKELQYLGNNEHGLYTLICMHLVVVPGKQTIDIEII